MGDTELSTIFFRISNKNHCSVSFPLPNPVPINHSFLFNLNKNYLIFVIISHNLNAFQLL